MDINRIKKNYLSLYPGDIEAFESLKSMMKQYAKRRSTKLVNRDVEGVRWIHSNDTVGIMLYVDLFSGDLEALKEKASYFKSLGINLVHLMPLLKPRAGENDGGYAVSNYREIDPRLGTMAVFQEVVNHFHENGIRVCIDYVLNHTADDHEWALQAKDGNQFYEDFYHVFEMEGIPKEYEKTMPEVFPKVAPGNFTYLESMDRWVMTTFYPYQWDLNYNNAHVFNAMAENLLFLCNIGIDMVRLDAVPYVWKRLETTCRNLPEAHIILNLLREICHEVAPSTALLGEAIMAPDTIATYFGTDERLECHALYNASYMVELWNTLATRDTRHLQLMPEYKVPEGSVWINYARCHDDIGWGLNERNLKHLGFDPTAHKSYLIDFYLGSFKDSFSKGALYEFNPVTLDARNSGTLASLCGLEKAIDLKSRYGIELAIKRILLIHAAFIFRKGIPMLYSGDEVGQINNYDYLKDDYKKHDSRWLHRQVFDWDVLSRLEDRLTPEGAVNYGIREIIQCRKSITGASEVIREIVFHQTNSKIFIIQQELSDSPEKILLMFNFSEDRQWLNLNELKRYGASGKHHDFIQKRDIDLEEDTLLFGPYEFFVIKM
ncbi:alpha-amylase family glycosyl hydrolase [Fusibacter tunisiensis]|uniref:Amylosucrase n=1 Tax=Fusibacter tunisiensis TaxID=1008308 RepID=A0ABS2MQM1_9FIRM|nr:amylosucrase [Fusibacter tunisiensis]